MKPCIRWSGIIALAATWSLLGCSESASTPKADAADSATIVAPTETVVATVNGVQILERDLRYWLRLNTRGQMQNPTPAQERNITEAIIGQELIRQRAVALGLDQNEQYRNEIQDKLAEIDSVRRTKIRDLYFQHLATEASTIGDGDVRQFYDSNAAQVRMTYHLQQIMRRSSTEIEEVQRKLNDGAEFEAIAAEPFAELSRAAAKPWDVKVMRWPQAPAAWRSALATLEPGAVSDVIRGPGNRFWIIRMVEKREDPSFTYESAKAALRTIVERDTLERMRETLDDRLRSEAEVVYVRKPGE